MDSHQGEIFVKSDGEGCGSTFTFLLPVTEIVNTTQKTCFESCKSSHETESFRLNQAYNFSSDNSILSCKGLNDNPDISGM